MPLIRSELARVPFNKLFFRSSLSSSLFICLLLAWHMSSTEYVNNHGPCWVRVDLDANEGREVDPASHPSPLARSALFVSERLFMIQLMVLLTWMVS